MKFSTVLFVAAELSLVFLKISNAQIASKFGDENKVLNHNAFGYLENIGIAEAERVFEEENNQLMPRIVGGETADIVQYNYQAGLIISIYNFTGIALCGGSIISDNRVVTAAHCWYDGRRQGTSMTVVLGSKQVFHGGTRIKTCEVYTHPDWEPAQASNDVAIVYLPCHVTFSETIAPIALPSKCEIYENFVGETAIASGFGKTAENISVLHDQVLSKVELTVISNEECSFTYLHIITSSNICTSGNNTFGNVATICSGDSGGPLVLTRKKKSILIGISSFGSPRGCDSNFPNGYSRVTAFLDFIKEHMKDRYCQ